MNTMMLGLHIESYYVSPDSCNYRPPSWPPSADWAPILDAEGSPVCRYADSIWPLDVWAGRPLKLNFGDGKARGNGSRVDKPNADLLRLCVTWLLWGRKGCRTAGSLSSKFVALKPLFVVCTARGIVASDLMRFEAVIDDVGAAFPPSQFGYVLSILHDLFDARAELGFTLLDNYGLRRLAKLMPDHHAEQTPYIPPRIWSYQVARLRECLEEYYENRDNVEACFNFCVEAYSRNYGSLSAAMSAGASDPEFNNKYQPFQARKSSSGVSYYGSFEGIARQFGIYDLLTRWIGPFEEGRGVKRIAKFSQYLDLASKAGLSYILNFSLMRIDEAYKLRSDCLVVEDDDTFGPIPVLVGETTKTLSDSDARWPVSKSVILAVDVMRHVARMRMSCARARADLSVSEYDVTNPFLVSYQYEPWSRGKSKKYQIRPEPLNYSQIVSVYDLLFDPSAIAVTEDDLRVARLVTPTLSEDIFKVGSIWRFSWHQLRRTGAVNMQASGMIDDASLQLQLKHQTRVMTLYYGRNHSRLLVSDDVRALYLRTMYEEVGRRLNSLYSSTMVSAAGESRKSSVLNLISILDAKGLLKAIKKGSIGVRPIRVGFCVNHRPCPYGGSSQSRIVLVVPTKKDVLIF